MNLQSRGPSRRGPDGSPPRAAADPFCSAWVSEGLRESLAADVSLGGEGRPPRRRRDAVSDGAVGGCGRRGHVIASCGRRSVAGCHVHYGWAPTPARHHYAHTPAINRFITLQPGRGREPEWPRTSRRRGGGEGGARGNVMRSPAKMKRQITSGARGVGGGGGSLNETGAGARRGRRRRDRV